MPRPVIGILSNSHLINESYAVQAAGTTVVKAVAEVVDAIPLVLPITGTDACVGELMSVCDGFVLPGGRPNVHPEEYGHEATEAHGTFDRDRDRLALDLIEACVDDGHPILGICRGFQEFNVAFGGTLHPEIRDIPGRMNHRMPPDGTLEEKMAIRHPVRLKPGGAFARLFGAQEVMVNSLHGQGIEVPGNRVIIEGTAPDKTPEAIRIEGASGFALAVQWHPEWRAGEDPVSRPLFTALGDAARARRRGVRLAAE